VLTEIIHTIIIIRYRVLHAHAKIGRAILFKCEEMTNKFLTFLKIFRAQ